jgi:hypothetical protein
MSKNENDPVSEKLCESRRTLRKGIMKVIKDEPSCSRYEPINMENERK